MASFGPDSADGQGRPFGSVELRIRLPALCHNCTYLSGFDLLALIEFRLESSRAAGVLREEISFLKRGSFAGGKEAGRRASRGSRRPCLLLKKAELAIQFRI